MPSFHGKASGSSRKPAQYGREAVRRITARWIVALVVLGGVPAVLSFALDVRSLLLVPLELAAIAMMLVIDRRAGPDIDRRVRGNRGEERVGEILAAMSAEGWCTLHDSVLGRGNIDHIVVGPGGLFTVETKSHRGRVDVERLDERWLKQAYAQRKIVERTVSCHAECLLVFSCAYLSRPVSRHRGVLVMPARMLAEHLKGRRIIYSREEISAIYAAILSKDQL